MRLSQLRVTWVRPSSAARSRRGAASGLGLRAPFAARSAGLGGSRCAAGRTGHGPRCSSSPTAASCEAGRCSGRICGCAKVAFWTPRSCSLRSGEWQMSGGTAGAAFWRPASSTCRSTATEDVGSGVALVAQRILSHGVTSFCPTLVTSPPEVYHKVLPQIPVKSGGPHGAGVLGVHLEGPFISREKRGAHPETHLRSFETNAFHDVLATYGPLDNVRIVTLAPELGRSHEVIQALTARGICVSLGHSVADLQAAEEAVQSGATFITHLFNAMLPFHHRDPGIVGLLTSDRLPPGRHIFYGMIADGTHTNPAALRIAHRAHPQGLVLVTDAVPALGLGNGRHTLGQQEVEVDGLTAYVAGTKTLSGSIAPMDVCVRHFLQATGCSVELALEAASLHPAQLLGLEKRKGTLDFGADADFVMLDDSLHVRATYISGELVWQAEAARQ
ncbi:N-acetylglucosamine-6-phosphate deacetylase isoform X3 [Vulpes vulpes]|uniref:N-acetylglucosamine-6-phosphate deacetylase n=1 Tax=Vulpes vulpes TaxID=9627 RepID=A0ABM5A5L0_VULVU